MVPGKPCELTVIEATKNYVVLSWKPPGEKGHEGIMYYVEKVQNLYNPYAPLYKVYTLLKKLKGYIKNPITIFSYRHF